jgi:beta-glucanase (GH16 family)
MQLNPNAYFIIGSTAPFQASDNHGFAYRSGMLQSWNKFCFTSGYIEVAVLLPGPNENTQGYVSVFRSLPFQLALVCVCDLASWGFQVIMTL